MAKEQKVIRSRLALLELAEQLGNVSQACRKMGYSRDSFHRFKELYDKGGEVALQEISQRKPVRRNVAEEIETAVLAIAIGQPALGRTRVANELKRRGLTVSPSGVRRIWLRHHLETMPKRLKAVETKIAQDGGIPTESQLAALEKTKTDKAANGELESEDPQADVALIVSRRSVVDPAAETVGKTVPVAGAFPRMLILRTTSGSSSSATSRHPSGPPFARVYRLRHLRPHPRSLRRLWRSPPTLLCTQDLSPPRRQLRHRSHPSVAAALVARAEKLDLQRARPAIWSRPCQKS